MSTPKHVRCSGADTSCAKGATHDGRSIPAWLAGAAGHLAVLDSRLAAGRIPRRPRRQATPALEAPSRQHGHRAVDSLGGLPRANPDWNRGFGVTDPSASSASGGLFSSLNRLNIDGGSAAPYWLQTGMPSGFGEWPPLPWSDPRSQGTPPATTRPLDAPDASLPFWLQTVLPFQANDRMLLSAPAGSEPSEVQAPQSPVPMWDLPPFPHACSAAGAAPSARCSLSA
jgi:hypothetical protein